MILDVRNRTEHTAGHIPGSHQLSGGRVMWHLDELPAEGTIVSYCQSGVRNSVAASAQYRVGRCLDALGRKNDATGTYQAVVSGYPLEPEAPAAAYLAGVGLLAQNRPRAAAPYFRSR
jgi:hydroxyacylglutathione hydrolase